MARGLLALVISAALSCASWTAARAQPIHEPPHVDLIDPASIAPAPAPPSVSPLTVEAAPGPKGVEKQTQSFVQTYAAAANPELGQIARWHDGVCVQVVGLIAPDQAARIAARIEDVARSLTLRVLPKGCQSNIQIEFTNRPQDVLDRVAARTEQVLGYHHPVSLKALKTVTHPIQAWYMTATRGGAGDIAALAFANTVGSGPPPAAFNNQQVKQEVIDSPENAPPAGCADSPHFTSCLKGVFKNVFMVADSSLVQGKDSGAVADYMAMLALSQPRSLDGCHALPSVIDLFAKAECPRRDRPDGLTSADAAYLTALYSADMEANKAGEQGDIARRMAKILITAHAVARAEAEGADLPPTEAKVR
jgi:hypothetical protein